MRGTILLLEDDADVRMAIAGLLEDEGYEVVAASNGLEGLRVLAGMRVPCLILLDLWMPVMTGREFLAQLAAVPAWRTLPVVVLTASDSPRPLGATALLRKPFPASKLLEFVAAHCVAPR